MTYYYNTAPNACNDAATTDYNTAVTVRVLANDYDHNGDWLRVTSVGATNDGAVVLNADGTVTFTPDPGFVGTTTFTYTITDGRGGYDTATVTINVCAPDSDGIVSGTAGSDLIDTAYTGDPDGDLVDANDAVLPGEYGDDDIIHAGAGNDTILAGNGNDEVLAGTGDDLIDGGAGNDSLRGEAGDDTFVGGAGNDTFSGGAGLDMVDYSASGAAVNVDLTANSATGGDATGDVLQSGIDGIFGSEFNDTLVGFDNQGTEPGDTFTNVFYGNDGDDLIEGRGGDDSLYGGADNDTIFGGSGDDEITGDAGADTIYGDNGGDVPSTAGQALDVDWGKMSSSGCTNADGALINGASMDLGGVQVTVGFTVQDYGATATVVGDTQYTESTDGIDNLSALKLYGLGGEGGADNTSTTTLDFSSTDAAYGDEVQNVSFRLNDIDVGTSTDFHIDIVTVRAYDADGNPVEVILTPEGAQTVSGNTVTGTAVDNGYISPSTAAGSVLVTIAGPVARIEIDYDNGGNTDQAIWVTDIYAETTDPGAGAGEDGNDLIDAGDDDDVVFGEGGNDTIIGGAGADTISGGDDRDLIFGTAGDRVDGNEGGDDWDTLDLTGQGAYRIINQVPDENGNGTNGTVEFYDADGTVTGTLDFFNIEQIIGDDVNYAPLANDDTASTDEDVPVTINVLGNDVDPDGDALSVTAASSPDGSVVINGDGTITFTPNADFNGETTINYTVTDENGDTDTATVTVTVTPVNDAPVANDDTASTDYATPVTIPVLANDTDIDGDALSVTEASSPNGSVVINGDGTLTFTPADGFEGEATISYTITDPAGLTDTATVTVTVAEQPLDGIVEGTAGDDLIDTAYTGDPEGDMVDAGDAILPGEAPDDDIIEAGAGNDTVLSGDGDDEVSGGLGDDSIFGNAGADEIDAGEGNDFVDGGAGDDTILGGAGDDELRGGEGYDLIDGQAGNDYLVGGSEDDTLLGGADNDTLQGADGNDLLDGGTGNDSANGGIGDDTLYGNDGMDTLDGSYGDDTLYGGNDDDVLKGGDGADSLLGEAGNDSVTGGTGNDTLIGGTGNDTLNGAEQDDVLDGGIGDDSILGGTGNDLADGGDGNDVIDTSSGESLPDLAFPGLWDADATPNDDLDTVYGGAGNDTITTGDDADYIDGGADDDVINAGVDRDTILGGDGNDYIIAGEGDDTVDAGAGNDTVYGGAGPGFPDAINIPDATDPVLNNGDDTIHGGDGNDVIYGEDDNDLLYGDAGADLLDGGIDEDTLIGGTGADTIIGGAAADLMDGGDDRDVFVVDTAGDGAGDVIDGGEGGDDFDTLDLTGAGPVNVIYTGPDANGNGYNGTVEFLDTDGNVVGTLDFSNIESVIYDDYAPDASDDTATTDEDTAVTIDVLANDTHPQNDTLSVTAASSPDGSVVINGDGTITFTPSADFNGETTISYTVTDENGDTDTATVTVTVTPVNDAPVANDDTASTPYATPVTIAVLANDTDIDGDALSVTEASSPNGSVVINGDGTLTFTPADGFEGEATISYTITDPEGLTDTATVTVTVAEQPLDGIVEGTAGADLIDTAYTGDPEGDMVDAGDAILGDDAPDDDRIVAGDGNDTVYAGLGDDTVAGDAGDDLIFGEDGNDSLDGGAGANTLDGGAGNDTLLGGDLGDSIVGGDGNDLAEGGAGDDVINTSGTTNPLPDLAYPGLWPADGAPNDDLDTVYGGAGNDTITTGDDRDYIDGGADDDVINAGFDEDTVFGGTGDDVITAGEGDDLVDGGDGNDTIYGGVGPGFPDAINVPDSTDPVQNNGDDTIHGGAGNDVIYGEDDNDLIYGDEGDDYIDGGIDGDTIFGGAGADTIVGGGDNDFLSGGADADTFIINTIGENGVNDVTVDGGFEGDDNDTLDYSALTAQGFEVVNIVRNPETNGNPGFNGQIQLYNPDTGEWANINFTDIENIVPCFTPGTLVATPRGERLVEELRVGDKVITRDNGIQEIRWAGRRDLSRAELIDAPHLKPVLIRAGSLGEGLPERDMLVSPNHRMLVSNDKTALYFEENEVLVAAKHLVDNNGVRNVETLGTSYLHFMFDHHEVVLANGAWTESFQPGDQSLKGLGNAQRAEIFEIFPELKGEAGVEGYKAARKTLKRHEARLLIK